jgi:hypothetical protein
VTTKHVHFHLNVKRTMAHADITADLDKALGIGADTVGFCEMETDWHHVEFWRLCRKYGYTGYLPDIGKRGSALGLAVRSTYGALVGQSTTFCAPGALSVSPTRYINQIQVLRFGDALRINLAETHQYSSGWTGTTSKDALRKLRWYTGMRVVTAKERAATKTADLVIGGGDLNRPPSTFKGPVLPRLLNPKGMKTVAYARTDATHGRVTFCYTWALSSKLSAEFTQDSTPSFNSDHDGILTTLTW